MVYIIELLTIQFKEIYVFFFVMFMNFIYNDFVFFVYFVLLLIYLTYFYFNQSVYEVDDIKQSRYSEFY